MASQTVTKFVKYLIKDKLCGKEALECEEFLEVIDHIMKNPIEYISDKSAKVQLILSEYEAFMNLKDPLKDYNTSEKIMRAELTGKLTKEESEYRMAFYRYVTYIY